MVTFELGENQPAGSGLKCASDDNASCFTDQRPRVINHDHRSILKITDCLMRFAALLDKVQLKFITYSDNWSQRARELIQIEC